MDVPRAPQALLPEGTDRLPVEKIPVVSLVVAGSPRSAGEDSGHAAALAEAADRLPPILVHRPTMRVIDGVHRLRAAKLRGKEHIDARLVDGDESACFVLAVSANTRHGLPLSLSDKKAAATRIISLYPQWSDRAIAAATMLHHQTVATIRARSTGEFSQPDTRIGRDGRSRPDDIAQRRELAGQLITSNPRASLREIASKARISPATVSRVRAELNGRDTTAPDPSGDGGRPAPLRAQPRRQAAARLARGQARVWQTLRADPALRSTQDGRALLQALSASSAIEERTQNLLDIIPPYSFAKVAEAACHCARVWRDIALGAEERNRSVLKEN